MGDQLPEGPCFSLGGDVVFVSADNFESPDSTMKGEDTDEDGTRDFYQKVSKRMKETESTFNNSSFFGPDFFRVKTTCTSQQKSKPTGVVKKKPEPIDFTKLDGSHKFDLTKSEETVLEDKDLVEWSRKKPHIPNLGCEINSYDEDLGPADFRYESDESSVPTVLRFFTTGMPYVSRIKNRKTKKEENV